MLTLLDSTDIELFIIIEIPLDSAVLRNQCVMRSTIFIDVENKVKEY